MNNFSSNNLSFEKSEVSIKADPKSKHKFSVKHTFRCRDTHRIYRYFQFTNNEKEIYEFVFGEIYCLTGYINVQGFAYFLLIQTYKIDEKSKLLPTQRIISGEKAENSIKPPIKDDP